VCVYVCVCYNDELSRLLSSTEMPALLTTRACLLVCSLVRTYEAHENVFPVHLQLTQRKLPISGPLEICPHGGAVSVWFPVLSRPMPQPYGERSPL